MVVHTHRLDPRLSKWILFWTTLLVLRFNRNPKITEFSALGCLSEQRTKKKIVTQFFLAFSRQTECFRNLLLNVRGQLQKVISQCARWTHDERTPSNQGRVLCFDFVQLFYFSFHFILVTFETPEQVVFAALQIVEWRNQNKVFDRFQIKHPFVIAAGTVRRLAPNATTHI